jgi:5'-3' exoribonuclease 1
LRFFKEIIGFRFEHLFMDCNSIVYDAVHSLEKRVNAGEIAPDSDMDTIIINDVIQKIDAYISIIRPSKTIYVAFDGVAPFAKMEQQRTRRYNSRILHCRRHLPGIRRQLRRARGLWRSCPIA